MKVALPYNTHVSFLLLSIGKWQSGHLLERAQCTMRFGSTTKVLAKHMLK